MFLKNHSLNPSWYSTFPFCMEWCIFKKRETAVLIGNFPDRLRVKSFVPFPCPHRSSLYVLLALVWHASSVCLQIPPRSTFGKWKKPNYRPLNTRYQRDHRRTSVRNERLYYLSENATELLYNLAVPLRVASPEHQSEVSSNSLIVFVVHWASDVWDSCRSFSFAFINKNLGLDSN